MEITRSVVSERDRALLAGDYHVYHAQASRRIHTLRKRLGTATPKGRKYTPKAAITPENVASNSEWVQLLLASAERAWAGGMAMKASQSQENTQKPMAGSTKRQIASRLRRAITYADNLVIVLQDHTKTGATAIDELEAKAYLSLLKGSLDFEKSRWSSCIQNYAVSRVIYATLGSTAKTDIYKDLLSSIVDPSIRYASYQLKTPRTKPVPNIVVERFPASETKVQESVKALNPQAFEISADATESTDGPKDIPSTIAWRNRKVKLEDAAISQALGLAKEREITLAEKYTLFQGEKLEARDLAAAYEEVITARQDAADATKSAIDELAAEGVDPGDSRMQSLQITRTAVNYAVIEWRIGRNRILCGPQDGLTFEPEKPKQSPKPRKDGNPRVVKEESSGRKLSRLRERTALYDSILQSLDAVKELPGVIADVSFVDELDAKRAYFRALKCLAIGRSHAVNGNIPNALVLYARASDVAKTATSKMKSSADTPRSTAPPKLDISELQLKSTTSHLSTLTTQYRALADLNSLSKPNVQSSVKDEPSFKPPFISRIHQNHFDDAIDLTNLVNYPPKLQPIPVKPLFFDLAWNYIQYPGHERASNGAAAPAVTKNSKEGTKEVQSEHQAAKTEEKPKPKSGWFGFGRS